MTTYGESSYSIYRVKVSKGKSIAKTSVGLTEHFIIWKQEIAIYEVKVSSVKEIKILHTAFV